MIVFSAEKTISRLDVKITWVVHRTDRVQDSQFSAVFDYSPGAGLVGGRGDLVNMYF